MSDAFGPLIVVIFAALPLFSGGNADDAMQSGGSKLEASRRFAELNAYAEKAAALGSARTGSVDAPQGRAAGSGNSGLSPFSLQTILEGPCHRTDGRRDLLIVSRMKVVYRHLASSADSSSKAGAYDDALDAAVLMLSLGNRIRTGATMEDHLAASVGPMFALPIIAKEVPRASKAAAVRCLARLSDCGEMDVDLNARIAAGAATAGLPPEAVRAERSRIAASIAVRESTRLADVQLTRVRLAVRIFECEHGEPPIDLNQLVPSILSTTPRDPCSQRLVVYRRMGRSFVLYSTGPDGRDDGGRKTNRSDLLIGKAGDLCPF